MIHLTRAAVALGAAAVVIAIIAGGTALAAWIVGAELSPDAREAAAGISVVLAILAAPLAVLATEEM